MLLLLLTFCKSGYFTVPLVRSIRNGILERINQARFHFRLAVLGKLNNFVKEWIAEISELKVSVSVASDDCGVSDFKLEAKQFCLVAKKRKHGCDFYLYPSLFNRISHHQL